MRLFALLALSLIAVANAACTTNPQSVIIPPPQLVTSTTNTHLTTDLKVAFSSSNGQLFSSMNVAFFNPTTSTYSSVCDVALTPAQLTGSGTTNLGSTGAWATTPTNTGSSCDTSFAAVWATNPDFHNALTGCFAFDNTSDPNYNFFTARVQITTTQDRPPIRGVAVTRTALTYTRFQFKLQRVVTIAASPTVNGQNLAAADVIQVLYGEINPSSTTTNVITVYFYTSTPSPYKLTPWNIASVYGAGLSSLPSFIGATLQGAVPYNVELLSYPSGVTGPALSCLTSDQFCTQLWRVQFVYTGVGTGTCSPSAVLRFSYSVQCQSGISGCVNPGNSNSYDLTTTLSATNLCSQLIQTTTITPSIALYKTSTDAAAATNPSSTFNLGDTVYTVTSMTSSNGPNLASASLVSFNLVSVITINGITVASPKGVNGVATTVYSNVGTTIRVGLSFVADTNSLQFSDLNSNQAVTITITWTALYDIPLSNSRLILQGSGDWALMDTPNSEDLSVTTAFVLTTNSGEAATTAASNTLAIAIGAVGGFCVVALLVVFIIYHRHVKKMVAANEQAKVQIFVPVTSSSNISVVPTTTDVPQA